MGKITKTEKYLLLLTAIFLLCLALLYFTDHRSAGGGDYTVTPQYGAEEPAAPDPPAVPGKVNINAAMFRQNANTITQQCKHNCI